MIYLLDSSRNKAAPKHKSKSESQSVASRFKHENVR